MKTNNLIGPLLDYWTVKAVGKQEPELRKSLFGILGCYVLDSEHNSWSLMIPSTNWAQGGPLIDQYDVGIDRVYRGSCCGAWIKGCHYESDDPDATGETRLIAACRAIVASVYGDTVPDLDPA